MPQGRQFYDPRFLGLYWLVGSTLDLELEMFFLFCVFLKEKWSPMKQRQINDLRSLKILRKPRPNFQNYAAPNFQPIHKFQPNIHSYENYILNPFGPYRGSAKRSNQYVDLKLYLSAHNIIR